MKSIKIRDLENYADSHWIEASGATEHWIQKHNGYPIPNIYASYILGKKEKDIMLSEDGIHYSRIIDVGDAPITKAIYGFRNEAFFDLVTRDIEQYTGFAKIKDIKWEGFIYDYSQDELNAMYVIDTINDYYTYRLIDDLTPNMCNALITSINTLKESFGDNPTINSYIEIGEYLLSDMGLLELHKMIDVLR